MSKQDLTSAYKLWKSYMVSTPAYRAIAAKYGITTADLNGLCSDHNREKHNHKK